MHEWFKGGGQGGTVDVAALLDSKAANIMGEIVQLGALLGLATTRDGGALSLTLTWDGEYRREYFRDADELIAYLEAAVPVFRELAELQPPAAAGTRLSQRKRAR